MADRYWTHHGTAYDAKWLHVAATSGQPIALVAATWHAILEHASAARPRGNATGFSLPAHAAFYGCAPADVASIIGAMLGAGLLDPEMRVINWSKRQGLKEDRTATERQRRRRARLRGDAVTPKSRRDTSPESHPSHGVTNQPENAPNPVTPCHAGGDIGGGDTALDLDTSINLDTSHEARIARAGAERGLSSTEVLDALTAAGIRITTAQRLWNIGLIRGWAQCGITTDQLGEALARATRHRERTGDRGPIHIKFLGCFVRDVLDGKPERVRSPATMEAGDDNLARFVDRHTR
ncbi:hypothetical protein [Microcystis phage MACPNOA1]|nr:hypothetical protein [Microcystis phage MACPNOA1]